MATELINQTSLVKTVKQLLIKERAMLKAIEEVLLALPEGEIKTSMGRKAISLREYVVALENNFIPVDVGGLLCVDKPSKWRRVEVKRILASMPDEVRNAWERIRALGFFGKFKISTGGDPVLVGMAGGKPFLIAAWVNVVGGASIGFCVKK